MKTSYIFTAVLWVLQFSYATPKTSPCRCEPIKISIDWTNPTNRAHPEKSKLSKLNSRQVSKLYNTNIKAASLFNKQGYVTTKGKTTIIDSDQNTLIFTIEQQGHTTKKELWIHVYPGQKLLLK